VRLVGVEGDQAHFGFMQTHLRDNGIDPLGHRLICAVVSAADGIARFPVLPDPSADWGASAEYGAGHDTGHDGNPSGARAYVQVPAISIMTLLRDLDRVDLMHCDIQGAEADCLEAAASAVTAKVRRLVVGTHGREIEGRLLTLLSGQGWTLEHEAACTFLQSGTAMLPLLDGVQVWCNPCLALSEDASPPLANAAPD